MTGTKRWMILTAFVATCGLSLWGGYSSTTTNNGDGTISIVGSATAPDQPGTPPTPGFQRESYEHTISADGYTTRHIRRIKDSAGVERLRFDQQNYANGHPQDVLLHRFKADTTRDGLATIEWWPNGRVKQFDDTSHFASTTIPPGMSGPLNERTIVKQGEDGRPYEFEFRRHYNPPNPAFEDNDEDLMDYTIVTLSGGMITQIRYKMLDHTPQKNQVKYYEFNVSPTGVVSGFTSGGF